MPKTLRAKAIPGMYRPICEQFMHNLLASGYRIINPDGTDITDELIANVVTTLIKGNPR